MLLHPPSIILWSLVKNQAACSTKCLSYPPIFLLSAKHLMLHWFCCSPDSTVGFVAGRADEIVDGKSKAAAIPTVNAGAEAGSETAFNDVWRSRTGAEWECVTNAAAWSPRAWVGGSAVLGGRMFVIGGGFIGGYDPSTDTVGYIQDTLVYPEPKPTRPSYNDVWSSANGVDWVCHCRHAAFRRRHYHEIMSWDNKLWVLEGYNGHPHLYPEEVAAGASELPVVGSEGNRNDVWYSSGKRHRKSMTAVRLQRWTDDNDNVPHACCVVARCVSCCADGGTNWHELPDTPWPKRHAASVTVHDDALWIAVGNTDWSGNPKLQGADGYRADVWALHRSSLASKL